jgi:outer membrane protein assembly factor BamB
MAFLFAALSGCTTHPAMQVTLLDKPAFAATWHAQAELGKGESVNGIYLVGDMIHLITDQNSDYAYKADTGELLYYNPVCPPDQTIKGGPALLPDDSVAIAYNRALAIYNNRGRLQRTIDVGFAITSPPTVQKGIIYVGIDESGGRFAAVDPQKQYNPMKWDVLTFGTVDGKPGIYTPPPDQGGQDQIFVGAEDGGVRAITDQGDSATPNWPVLKENIFATRGKIRSGVQVDSYGVYFAATDGVVYCVDRDTGKLKWRYFSGGNLQTAPQVTANTVYQYVPGTGIVAIDKVSMLELNLPEQRSTDENPFHTARWTVPNATRFLSEDDKYSYLLSTNNTILAVDKQTGAQAFESQRKDLAVFTTSTDSPLIYAATSDGIVLAIKPMPVTGSFGQMVMNIRRPVAGAALAAAR